jgi:hypothetical protein
MNSFLFVHLFEQMFVTIVQDHKGYGFLSAMNKLFHQHPSYFMYLWYHPMFLCQMVFMITLGSKS